MEFSAKHRCGAACTCFMSDSLWRKLKMHLEMKSNVEERGMSKATKVEKPEEVYEEQIV